MKLGRGVVKSAERAAGRSACTQSAAFCAATPVGKKSAFSLPSAAAISASNDWSHSPWPYASCMSKASSDSANAASSRSCTCTGLGLNAAESSSGGASGAPTLRLASIACEQL